MPNEDRRRSARHGWHLALVIMLLSVLAPASASAAVVSTGVSLVGPFPGFGPANPAGCAPATSSNLTLAGSFPFEPSGGTPGPGGTTVNTSHVKVDGLVGVVTGTVMISGSIVVGPQMPTGTAPPASQYSGPVNSASGSFSLTSGATTVAGTFSTLLAAPPGQVVGLNTGSCYGDDAGDANSATSNARTTVDLRVAYSGTRTDGGAPNPISGELIIVTSSSCTLFTVSTGACGGSAQMTFAPPAAPSCVNPLLGMIGWWRGEGSTVAVVGPDLDGSSGFGGGTVGTGFDFDGDMVTGTSALATVGDGVTVEAWIAPDADPVFVQTIASRWDFPSPDDSARSYVLQLHADGALVWETDETSTRRPEVTTASAPQLFDGNLHHVAATWNQSRVALYVDGVEVGSRPSQGGTLNPAATTQFRVGSQARGFGFRGVIDEPTVYSRALTASEIAAIVAAGAAGKCSPA